LQEEIADFLFREVLPMKSVLNVLGSLGIAVLCFQLSDLSEADSQSSNPSSNWTDSQARKMLSDSPWARRVKIRSTIKEPTYNQDMGNPGNNLGGFGPGGLRHGVVPPSATEIINQAAGPQTIPCLGWGIGSMTMDSPTSEECKAAWQSVSAAKSRAPEELRHRSVGVGDAGA
jgi:hypothetical protein